MCDLPSTQGINLNVRSRPTLSTLPDSNFYAISDMLLEARGTCVMFNILNGVWSVASAPHDPKSSTAQVSENSNSVAEGVYNANRARGARRLATTRLLRREIATVDIIYFCQKLFVFVNFDARYHHHGLSMDGRRDVVKTLHLIASSPALPHFISVQGFQPMHEPRVKRRTNAVQYVYIDLTPESCM